jgi:predicted aldo/keto reductase-like oxidoreductase
MATWNGFRVDPSKEDYLSLEEMALLAREIGGTNHHFRFIQLPFNLAMPEAWVLANQKYGGNWIPLFGMAERVGISVIGSASLLQARLAGALPDFFRKHFPQLKTSAQCSLQFARSMPGMTTSLVGMKSKNHVLENLELAKVAPLTQDELFGLFQEKA